MAGPGATAVFRARPDPVGLGRVGLGENVILQVLGGSLVAAGWQPGSGGPCRQTSEVPFRGSRGTGAAVRARRWARTSPAGGAAGELGVDLRRHLSGLVVRHADPTALGPAGVTV